MAAAAMASAVAVAMPAAIAVIMLVMAACRIRIIGKRTCQQCGDRLIGISGYAGIQADPRLSQRLACAHTDAAADQRIHAFFRQKSRQRAVTRPLRVYHGRLHHRAVFRLIEFKLLRMAKMAKHAAVFIGYCNFIPDASMRNLSAMIIDICQFYYTIIPAYVNN